MGWQAWWIFVLMTFVMSATPGPNMLLVMLPAMAQFVILLTTFTVIELSGYLIYALSGHKLSQYLRQAHVLKIFNRVTGGVFVGFAAWMAASR